MSSSFIKILLHKYSTIVDSLIQVQTNTIDDVFSKVYS